MGRNSVIHRCLFGIRIVWHNKLVAGGWGSIVILPGLPDLRTADRKKSKEKCG
jgi:hypothetical protein